MELIKEYLDEKTNKYVLEFNATAEEKEALETKCHELNLTVDELAEKSLRWCIDNPDKFKKWIKESRTDKNSKGTIGHPKYKRGDKTGFYITPHNANEEIFCIGTVEIVDAYGTFEQKEEPSYDIMVEDFNGTGRCLVKHIRESDCYNIK